MLMGVVDQLRRNTSLEVVVSRRMMSVQSAEEGDVDTMTLLSMNPPLMSWFGARQPYILPFLAAFC
jgi:hypothetical protein